MSYPVLTLETAPKGAKDALKSAQDKFGFVPNLIGVLANAPVLPKAYLTLAGIFDETSFSPAERQVVLLAASYENDCEYCVAAHTAIAGLSKVPSPVIEAVRQGQRVPDAKLEALRRFTLALVATRGRPSQPDLDAFFRAGYGEAQVLEVILGVAVKTLANYANHLAETPLDEAFQKLAWTKAA